MSNMTDLILLQLESMLEDDDRSASERNLLRIHLRELKEEFERFSKLANENELLRKELRNLVNVVSAGDWHPKGDFAPGQQMMHILFKDADTALDRAEKVLDETGHE